MRTHHHFGIRLNPFMFLRTELRSKWSDCEPCEKTHHVKSDLSRATKKLLKFAKTRFEEKPVTVKSWGEGVDAENEALANVVSAWAGVPKEDGGGRTADDTLPIRDLPDEVRRSSGRRIGNHARPVQE